MVFYEYHFRDEHHDLETHLNRVTDFTGNSDNRSKMTSISSEGTKCDTVGSERERVCVTSSLVLRVRECSLICLLCRPENFFILNLAYAQIPDAPFSNPILAYEFGYASYIEDYKLVVLIKHKPLVAVFFSFSTLYHSTI